MGDLAKLILAKFKGRTDTAAVQTLGAPKDAFHPEKMEVTAELLADKHLAGIQCLGFYVLTAHAKCFCTCVDFDNKPEKHDPTWKMKVEQLYYSLAQLGLCPLVELSQSGSGAHVWLFFSEPVDAWVPRSFWKAMERKLDTKFVEIYPRQASHIGPKELGNLIRYPLWKQSAFVEIDNDWMVEDPTQALSYTSDVTAAELKMLSFQCGMGELMPEPEASVDRIDVGEKTAIVSPRVRKLVCESNTLAGRRWKNDAVGMADKSKSAVAMSLCCELVRGFIPTPEIACALRAWCELHGAEEKGKRDDWVNRTVSKAYDFVSFKMETKSVSATTFRDAAHAYVDLIENNSRIWVPSGISELDESIDGVAPGEVAIIAGRPGHGKSAVAIQWLANAARLGVACLMVSEEMGMVEIGKRRLMSVTTIAQEHWVAASAHALRKDIDSAHRKVADVYLTENCCTIDRAEEVIGQFATLYNVGLVAVDYLQLLGSKTTDRYEVVTECSRRIKQTAKKHGVAILLLSQLNRQVEGRDDNEPKMSDLRESGGIEQDADLILFAQYPCRFDANMPKDLYRIIAGKRRNGPIRQPRMEIKFDPARQIIGMPELPAEVLDV
jgi:KaiC/GvpD/RAD55 family RecA-like ATPase